MKVIAAAILTFLLSPLAIAQNGVGFDLGNGGMAVSFDSGNHWSTLDLAEGIYRGVYPWKKLLVPPNRNQVLKLVIDRAISKCPAYFSNYYELVDNFYADMIFAGGPGWERRRSTDDANISLPEGQYVIAQAAVQKPMGALNQNKFFLIRSVWNQLPAVDQAALIIHEIMYRQFIVSKGATNANSDRIRPSVAYLFSEDFSDSNNPGGCEPFQ